MPSPLNTPTGDLPINSIFKIDIGNDDKSSKKINRSGCQSQQQQQQQQQQQGCSTSTSSPSLIPAPAPGPMSNNNGLDGQTHQHNHNGKRVEMSFESNHNGVDEEHGPVKIANGQAIQSYKTNLTLNLAECNGGNDDSVFVKPKPPPPLKGKATPPASIGNQQQQQQSKSIGLSMNITGSIRHRRARLHLRLANEQQQQSMDSADSSSESTNGSSPRSAPIPLCSPLTINCNPLTIDPALLKDQAEHSRDNGWLGQRRKRPVFNFHKSDKSLNLFDAIRFDSSLPIERQSWFHGSINKMDAEFLLRETKPGTYLVRKGEQRNSVVYSLSVRSILGVMHVRIYQKMDNGPFTLGTTCEEYFETIPLLIEHFSMNGLPIQGAEHVALIYPMDIQLL
ncbi:hypothetical protein BLOT_011281 [Blomia tropicalis]|nr:hypothetical protein BLOT_011281 [Blomia tropicalis]